MWLKLRAWGADMTHWFRFIQWHFDRFAARWGNILFIPTVLVLLGVYVGLTSGCAGWQQPFTQEPYLTQVCVSVAYHDTQEAVARACGDPCSVGCATGATPAYPVSWQQLLRPRAWDDQERVCAMGHEFLRSLGARHK